MKFVDVSAPAYAKNGSLAGVLAAHLSWDWAREIQRSSLSSFKEESDIDLFVVSTDDVALLGSEEFLGRPFLLEAVRTARAGAPGWTIETWPDGRQYLTGAACGHGDSRGLGWTIVARQPLTTAYRPVERLSLDVLGAGVALALVFGAAGWLIASRIARPLRDIANAAERLRAGEDVAIPQYRGVADIETLSASLRSLVESLVRSESARSRMESLATVDHLTGLPNRLALEKRLESALPTAKLSGDRLLLFCLDLDGFKAVNDSFGHPAGDALLQEVARRLRLCQREDDLAVRLGGDEFALMLSGCSPDTAAEAKRAGKNRLVVCSENGASMGSLHRREKKAS